MIAFRKKNLFPSAQSGLIPIQRNIVDNFHFNRIGFLNIIQNRFNHHYLESLAQLIANFGMNIVKDNFLPGIAQENGMIPPS